MGSLMTAVAGVYDGAQFLVDLLSFGLLGWLINPLIDLWAFMTFFMWFSLRGASFARPSRALTMGLTSFLEMVPFFNDLPTWTAGVIIMVGQTYAEDVVGQFSPLAAKALGQKLTATPAYA